MTALCTMPLTLQVTSCNLNIQNRGTGGYLTMERYVSTCLDVRCHCSPLSFENAVERGAAAAH